MLVVCIKDIPIGRPWGYGDEVAPYVGQVLTVRGEMASPFSGKVAWTFHEIINPPRAYMVGVHEMHFLQMYFRPVRSSEAGMEILRGILNGEKVKERT